MKNHPSLVFDKFWVATYGELSVTELNRLD